MAELAAETKRLDFKLEQVQDFTPTPMTVSTEIYYTGYHPYTLEKTYTAHTKEEKLQQRQYFFWYQPESRRTIQQALIRLKRPDLLQKLYPGGISFNSSKPAAARDTGKKEKISQNEGTFKRKRIHDNSVEQGKRREDPFKPGKTEASRISERERIAQKAKRKRTGR